MMTEEDRIRKIEQVLDQLRPNIQMDGGDISFVKYENGIVFVKLLGACVGCPAAFYTLKMGVEDQLKNAIPDVDEVMTVDEI